MSSLGDDLRESIRIAQRRKIAAFQERIDYLTRRGLKRDQKRIAQLRNLIQGIERDMRQGVLVRA